ncbi:ribokinase [Companilactobacillus sp. RD055328]|uniref:ribokinase n=1 Tax=Companilactobacillus sp. RD055328 TaxID=2916634 RepID=UPI001FC8AF3D|nr:ribokinase [Companilactobacillus sp. RD055328]GKQ43140.1 ribokinase [Companilactobacillus sp. RD055328]
MTKVVVLGSTNVDTILNVSRFPLPGETMAMNDRATAGGGKGANQALAAARLGADTSFISRVGSEGAAEFMLDTFKEDGMHVDHITTSTTAGTGQAYILVEEAGQNSILIYAGANAEVGEKDILAAEDTIKDADILIAQFEVPIPAIIKAFEIATANGVKTILNPAPGRESIPAELIKLTDIIIPNETEAQIITGVEVTDRASMDAAAAKLMEMGVSTVLITVGSEGSYYNTGEKSGFVNAFKVEAKDTTAAGDTFIGAFSSQIKPDLSNIEDAMRFANKASSLAVQKSGAQTSIPYEKDINL